MFNDKRENDLVNLCQELIRRPSPSGREGDMAAFLRQYMLSVGYDSVEVDTYGNVVGKIVFDRPGRTLLMEAQMDHVETGDPGDWMHYPYGALVEGRRLFGRGASDQKGSLAAMILAAIWLRDDRRDSLCGELVVSGTVYQEFFEGRSSRLVYKAARPDYVITGEASGLVVERGQRGRAELVIETYGRMAHSANPGYGVNAVDSMVKILNCLYEKYIPARDPFLGEGILVLTNINSYPSHNSGAIPTRCRATFDRRLLVGESREEVLAQIRHLIESISRDNPEIRAEVTIPVHDDRCYTGAPIRGDHFAPAWLLSKEDPFVRKALDGLQRMGISPRLSESAGFGTNGCYYGGAENVPTIVFGPSNEELAHIVDEYIEIDQLIQGCWGYYGIASEVLSED